MKKSFGSSIAVAAFLFTGAAMADPLPVTGQWRTISDTDGTETSVIELYEQGGKVFGKVVSLKKATNAQGKPLVCDLCEGADKGKPLVGLVVLKNLTRDGDEYSGGTIVDPNDGKTYRCNVEAIEGGKKLKVRGFIGISLFGRTQVWLKK